jgi:N-acyl-D-aspartate/D-glutamate deacylase
MAGRCVGAVGEGEAWVIDADGLLVSPVSSTSTHFNVRVLVCVGPVAPFGVTTVVGNCGFSVAP